METSEKTIEIEVLEVVPLGESRNHKNDLPDIKRIFPEIKTLSELGVI